MALVRRSPRQTRGGVLHRVLPRGPASTDPRPRPGRSAIRLTPAGSACHGRRMFIYIPLIVCLVSLFVYGIDNKIPKLTEVARLAFAVSLLVVLFQLATGVIHP